MVPDISGFIQTTADRGLEMHSLIVLKDGDMVAREWWDPFRPEDAHYLYSLSKSFCSTAIGLLIHEGKLTLDTPVLEVLRDEAPSEPTESWKRLTVRHLLTMSMGLANDGLFSIFGEPEWTPALLRQPMVNEPGTQFMYDSGATYALSAIHHHITGGSLVDYLTPRLFAPLGIENVVWEKNPQGIDMGGVGLSLTTDSIAKFGQLLLQKGVWHGERLIPAEWIELATSKQIDNAGNWGPDWSVGYGFQFWRCVPEGCYRGDGAFGQICLVDETVQTVVAITSFSPDLQALLDTCYEFLTGRREKPVLEATSKPRLEVPRPVAAASPEATCLGAYEGGGRQFEVGASTISIDGTSLPISGEWTPGVHDPWSRRSLPMASAAAWTLPQQLVVKIQHTTYPANILLTLDFQGNEVTVTPEPRGFLLPVPELAEGFPAERR